MTTPLSRVTRALLTLVLLLTPVGPLSVPAPAGAQQPAPTPPASTSPAAMQPAPIVIGSKPFGESYLLAEIFAQLLEARGHTVTRRLGLGGTEILFPALVRGDIDVYPEYSGSGLRVILKEDARRAPADVFDTVSRTFAATYDVRWLPPLGF